MTGGTDTATGAAGLPTLEGLVNHLESPMYVKDRQLRFVLVNRAFGFLAGRPLAACLGQRESELETCALLGPAGEAEDRAVLESEVGTRAERLLDPDGDDPRALEFIKTPLRDAAGVITHVVCIVHDITDLKHGQEELRRLNEQLEERVAERTEALRKAQQELLHNERMAVLGQLSAGLAHQIRNPLAAISNAAAVLERGIQTGQTETAVTATQIIREEVFSANGIITDLLDYARIRPARLGETDAAELVEFALSTESVPDGITVAREAPGELYFQADVNQLAVALRKLIRNAFEALSERGGTVTVAVETRPVIDAALLGQASADGDPALASNAAAAGSPGPEEVVITVSDEGPGMLPQELDRVFEPLVSSKPWGLGLGLATARALVENQGGRVEVGSVPGEGASFTIHLPLDR